MKAVGSLRNGVFLVVLTARMAYPADPAVVLSPESFAVTNELREVSQKTLIVSNAMEAAGNLHVTLRTRATGQTLVEAAALDSPERAVRAPAFRPDLPSRPDRVLVRFAPGSRARAQRDGILAAAQRGARVEREFRAVPGLCVVELPKTAAMEKVLDALNRAPGVLYAEPDYEVHLNVIPNDARFSELWGLHNTGQTGGTPDADIDAPEAWDTQTGSRDIVVAVIDTGVDYLHEDLAANMWINPGEIPGNGIDDDGNGYVDDIYGINAITGSGDPMDDHNHGTHCAGTIGAVGNNSVGVAGVAWNVRIMGLKFLSAAGRGYVSDAIRCIEYAIEKEAHVMSNSWGGGGYSQALKDAIDAAGAAGISFVAAAGNSGRDNDVTPHYPSNYDSENVISVMATDHRDRRSVWALSSSCYGATTVDLGAPGSSILSCIIGDKYAKFNGTSMATPHVAGAIALMLSQNPFLTVAEYKSILLDTVDIPDPELECVSRGRLNAARALAEAGSPWLKVDPREVGDLAPGGAANVTVTFDAVDLPAGTYEGEIVVISNDPLRPVTHIPCTMVILPDDLHVSPRQGLDAEGIWGGPFIPESTTYLLRNDGTSSLAWSAGHATSWLDVTPASGTLAPGETTDVLVAFNALANDLEVGAYADTVAFVNAASGYDQPRSVRLAVRRMYFVNDASTNLDAWCTAPGDDAHDGKSPARPKATVQALLDEYVLQPGDVVRIDTGTYALTDNIVVAAAHSGGRRAPVVFEASPYGVTFDRRDTTEGSYAWHLDGASNVTLRTATSLAHPGAPRRFLQVTGAYHGVHIAGQRSRLERLDAVGNLEAGLYLNDYSGSLCTLEKCLLRGSTGANGAGIHGAAGSLTMNNCTVAGNNRYGVYLRWSAATLRNNIIAAAGSGRYGIYRAANYSLNSDYNDLWVSGGARIGFSGTDCTTLVEWRGATDQDAHSFSRDPRFVDAAGGDYHLQSTAGSYHGGAWTADGADSPAIDMGQGDAGDEPEPNATPLHGPTLGRRNLGAYGGTDQGSKTPAGRALWLYGPIGGESYPNQDLPIAIRWTWTGTGWEDGATVRLDYWDNAAGAWYGIDGAAALAVSSGLFSWDVSALDPGLHYRVRVTCNEDAAATDASASGFRIGGVFFYVNDASTNLDAWCTAPGDDNNDGLTPQTPKATVQSVLAAYDLEPGDRVRIDTGTYNLTGNITVTSADGGSAAAPVVFEASPYGVTFDRGSTAAGSYGWHINAALYVTLRTATSAAHPGAAQRWMRVTGADYGVFAGGAYCRVERVEASENNTRAIHVGAANVTMENCLARGSSNTNSGTGIHVAAANAAVLNCTVVENGKYGIYIGSYAGTVVRNSIVTADGSGRYAIYRSSTGHALASDFNNLRAVNGARVGYSARDRAALADWQDATGLDGHSLARDPRFVNAAGGDYHLQSTEGSYHGGAWTADPADSPGIDQGLGDAGLEPEPNGTPLHGLDRGLRNLGAYGGTEQGSKTPASRLLWLLEPVGGEIYANQSLPVTVRWMAIGTAWQGADTIRLEYSADSGGSWNDVAGASAVTATEGRFDWDVSGLPAGRRYRVRLTCNEDTAATDASAGDFRIGPQAYYINDASTDLDAWCIAPGDDANDGLTPASPMAGVQALIDRYDLKVGDTVRIDTGHYHLNANITVAGQHQGIEGLPIVFEASPYGVTFDRGSTASGSYAWHINGARHVTLRTAASAAHPGAIRRRMRVTGANHGLYVGGQNCRIERIDADANLNSGIYLAATDAAVDGCLARGSTSTSQGAGISIAGRGAMVRNCLVTGNPASGIRVVAPNVTVENSTIVGSHTYGIYIGLHSGTVLRNNIIVADGPGRYGIYRYWTNYALTSDDNNVWAVGGAFVGYSGATDRPTLAEWRLNSGQDAHSFSRDPRFVDAAGGDYHLQSTAGSYHGGAWMPDAADSPGLDTGCGDAGAEPAPNATPWHGADRGRRNQGAYGGTEQGSKTPAGRLAWLYAPIGGETYPNQAAPVPIRWTWTGTGWMETDTVRLEYSYNAGASWQDIPGASALPATDGQFSWDISGLLPSPVYRVRVTCNQDATAADASAGDIRIGTNVIYYVNDASTDLDAWCMAPGDDANDGLTPATPKAGVQAVLDAYDLEPGDTVRIDTGTYALTNNITVPGADGGSADAPVIFEASPYGVTFDRGSTAAGSYAWNINGAAHVTLRTAESDAHPGAIRRWMRVTGADYGIFMGGSNGRLERVDADGNRNRGIHIGATFATVVNCRARSMSDTAGGAGIHIGAASAAVYGCVVEGNGMHGVYIGAAGARVEHTLARGSLNQGSGAGIHVASSDAVVRNCTVVENGKYGIYIGSVPGTKIQNNVIVADGSGDYGIYRSSTGHSLTSNFNNVWAVNGAHFGYSGAILPTLTDWWTATGQDANSLSRDPLFVDAAGGDYHLQSTAGSYHGGDWTADGADSPGIDTGHGDAGAEPEPNATPLHGPDRGRRNLGAYGGTDRGSKTPARRMLWLHGPLGGERFLNQAQPVSIRWTWVGTGWQEGDTVRLEYSADSGGAWYVIAGASALAVTNGQFSWDISALTPGPLYRVRVTANPDAAATDASRGDIRIGTHVSFYVNDASTELDAWCIAPGHDGSDGLTPATPKAGVQAVIDAYLLEPGDTVRIDTGTYALTNNITVSSADGGSAGAPVVFEASPYGVTFDRGSTAAGSYGWHINGAAHVTLRTAEGDAHPGATRRWMRVTGANHGIVVGGSHCRLERLDVNGNLNRAIHIGATYATVTNCLAGGSASTDSGTGIHIASMHATINACRVFGNGLHGIYVGSTQATIANSLVGGSVSESGGAGIYIASGSATANNCTVVENGKYGIYIASAGSVLRNNIVGADGPGRYGIYRAEPNLQFTSDYNDLWATNGAHVGFSAVNRTTLAAWRAATGQDANSLDQDPLFMGAGDHRLRYGSPCVDAGHNAYIVGSMDVDGRARLVDGDLNGVATVDMGAHEYDPWTADSDGDGMPDGWEHINDLDALDPDDAHLDPDEDGFTNLQEYIADTDPNDGGDYFRIVAFTNVPPWTVFFTSSGARVYTLLGCTNLVKGAWTPVPGAGPRMGAGGLDSMQDANTPPYGPFYLMKVELP